MQICNYTPAQDLDRLVAIRTLGCCVVLMVIRTVFISCWTFFSPKKYLYAFLCLCVSPILVSIPV